MTTKVKNLNGTSDRECSCDSWTAHWENWTGKTATTCANTACDEFAEVGAHVKKVGADDDATYIVPLCKACNQLEDEFSVDQELAPANVAKTCGKGK